MPVEVELFDDLDAVARDANGALDRDARASLFERLDWYRLTAKYAPPPGKPLILRARDGAAQAWLFLAVDGRRAHALSSWYTLHYGAVFAAEGAPAYKLAVALARALRRRRPSIATVDLQPLDAGDLLPWAFRRAGWLTDHRRSGTNWTARTEGLDFETWWSQRPTRLQHTVARKAKVAELAITIHRAFDAAAWSQYEAIYRASWKPSEGSPFFLRALAQKEGAAGTLRLGIAMRHGDAVAAQLWLVENGVATIHKLAHVESARALSPGTVLSMAMFRHVIDEDRPSLIDFGTGDDAYKADWMDQRRPLYRLAAFNPLTLPGLAGAGRRLAAKLVRRAPSD
jgi:CelD/BcsL family acetyltransferase involved in cellulose biosynthesis